jgi:hypothetical protein
MFLLMMLFGLVPLVIYDNFLRNANLNLHEFRKGFISFFLSGIKRSTWSSVCRLLVVCISVCKVCTGCCIEMSSLPRPLSAFSGSGRILSPADTT